MKNLIVAVGMVLVSGVAFAQPGDAQERHPHGKSGGPPPWFDEIGVTEEQHAEMRAIRESGGSRDDIKAVLTSEQQQQLDELKEARGGSRADRIEVMKERLDLSDEQVAQMQEIREEGGNREDMFEVLTPEQQEKLKHAKGKRKRQQAPREE